VKRRQLGLGKLLAIIAVLAIDLAAGRAILTRNEHFGWNVWLLIVVTPIGLTLQAALFYIVSSQGRSRIFWTGFLTSGILAMISILFARYDPPCEMTTISSSGITRVSYYPGGPMARLWGTYSDLAYAGLERLGYPYTGRMTDWRSAATDAVAWFLPQLLMAWAGGLLARLIGGRWCLAPSEQPATEAGSVHLPENRGTTRLIVAVVATSVIPLAAATRSTWLQTREVDQGRALDQLQLPPIIDDIKFFPAPSEPEPAGP
jgi:hypothetical protein